MDSILFIIVAVILLFLLVKLISAPVRLAVKLGLHALMGFVALFLFNFFGSTVGLTLELSWLNAIVTGLLGVPGVVVLLLIQFLL